MATKKRKARPEVAANGDQFPDVLLDPDGYVGVKQFARYFSISLMTVYRRIDDGSIPVLRIGRAIRIPKQSVKRFVKESEWSPGQPVLAAK